MQEPQYQKLLERGLTQSQSSFRRAQSTQKLESVTPQPSSKLPLIKQPAQKPPLNQPAQLVRQKTPPTREERKEQRKIQAQSKFDEFSQRNSPKKTKSLQRQPSQIQSKDLKSKSILHAAWKEQEQKEKQSEREQVFLNNRNPKDRTPIDFLAIPKGSQYQSRIAERRARTREAIRQKQEIKTEVDLGELEDKKEKYRVVKLSDLVDRDREPSLQKHRQKSVVQEDKDSFQFGRLSTIKFQESGFLPDMQKSKGILDRMNQRQFQNGRNQDSHLYSNYVQKDNETVLIGRSVGFTLKHLREIENNAALKIQTFVKKALTRKWYLNFQIRRRLSMPFSGLEMSQNPFLRQFQRINLKLHTGFASAGMADVIKMEQDERRNLIFSWPREKPGIKVMKSPASNKPIGKLIKTPASKAQTLFEPRKKVMTKGKTPEQLLQGLKDDFISGGLDAYNQFKRLGAGLKHTESGFPYLEGGNANKLVQETKHKDRHLPEYRPSAQGEQERPNIDPSMIFFQEPQEYLLRAEGKAFASRGDFKDAGKNTSEAMRLHQYRTTTPQEEETKLQDILEIRKNLGEEAKFSIEGYQTFSREPIVFHKMLGSSAIKWTIVVCNAFRPEKHQKLFIPVKLIGQPLRARSTVVSLIMNLEMLDVSLEATKSFNFETIWPFILYLFNNWIKHQVKLMGIKRVLPKIAQSQKEKGLKYELPEPNFNMFEYHKELQEDFKVLEDEEYRDMLNFSSEIEFDDRFEQTERQQVQIDKSWPQEHRPLIGKVKKDVRKKMFEQYWNSVRDVIDENDIELETAIEKEVQAANDAVMEEQGDEAEIERLKSEAIRKTRKVNFNNEVESVQSRKVEFSQKSGRKVNQRITNVKLMDEGDRQSKYKQNERPAVVTAPISEHFINFLASQFVSLPKEQSKALQLMQAMQGSIYHLIEKEGGLTKMNIAFLNEERRKQRRLPPLSQLDYNCMDRASIKLRTILDCLQVERVLSGTRIVPRSLQQLHRMKSYEDKIQKEYYQECIKLDRLSIRIMKILGLHIEVEPQLNSKAISLQHSALEIRGQKVNNKLINAAEQANKEDVKFALNNMQARYGLRQPSNHFLSEEGSVLNIGQYQGDGLFLTEQDELVNQMDFNRIVSDSLDRQLLMDQFANPVRQISSQGQEQHFQAIDEELLTKLAQERALEENQVQELLKFKLKREQTEIESVLEDKTILDQGCIRFNNRIFMANLMFRKIHSNLENMLQIIRQRENKFQDDVSFEQGDKVIGYRLMDSRAKAQRLVSQICGLVSENIQVITNDNLELEKFDDLTIYDLKMEMNERERTTFESYAEIKVFSKLSTTTWQDNVFVSWETLQKFFHFFGCKFNALQLLKNGILTKQESFLFYRFLPECLALDQQHGTNLVFDIQMLDAEKIKFDQIYLNLRRERWIKDKYQLQFYLPDILDQTNFVPDNFDDLVFPFFDDPKISQSRKFKIPPETFSLIKPEVIPVQKESAYLEEDFILGEKPQILVDENTKEYIQDVNHLFNLTLTNYPNAMTIYLGRLFLQPEKSPPCQTTSSISKHPLYLTTTQGQLLKNQTLARSQLNLQNKQLAFEASTQALNREGDGTLVVLSNQTNLFNVRIDYFVQGVMPIMEIKANHCITQIQLKTQIHDRKQIKAIIRICGQTQHKMVLNQLQSLIVVKQGTNGKKLALNFDMHVTKQQHMVVALYTMLVFNEALLRERVGPHNLRQFKQIMNLKNVSAYSSNLMVQLTEYTVDVEMLQHGGDLIMQMVHGNKHLTAAQIIKAKEKIVSANLDTEAPIKVHRSVKVWKIALFNMRQSRQHECVLTQQDLETFYESDVFAFFKKNPQVAKPSLIQILEDYLLNLHTFRTPVGNTLAWTLPQFKKPLNNYGLPVILPKDQYYNFEELVVYKEFKYMLTQAMKQDDEANKLPLSLDNMKDKHTLSRVPQLALKARLLIERVLPIYPIDDFMSLRMTSTQQRIITNRVKVFKSLSDNHFCLVTVTLHEAMECWIWQLYFPSTQRTFISTFYSSDLFNISQDNFQSIDFTKIQTKKQSIKQQKQQKEALIWQKLIEIAIIDVNKLGDMILVVDSYREPIRELLFQTYTFNKSAHDLFYIEVTVKSYANYVTDAAQAFQSVNMQDSRSKELTISLKAFSLTRNIWIKDYQPLTEIIRLLQQENLLHEDIKNFYFSMIRNAAILLAHRVQFSKNAQTVDVKKRTFTYDVTQQILQKLDPTAQPSPRNFKTSKEKLEGPKPTINQEWQNIIQLNRIIYQATIAINPIQICTISYNEAKDKFLFKLYRPIDSTTIEKRFDGNQIQRTCAPYYIQMLRKGMEQELGERIADYYYANVLIASVMQANNLQALTSQYEQLSKDIVYEAVSDPNQIMVKQSALYSKQQDLSGQRISFDLNSRPIGKVSNRSNLSNHDPFTLKPQQSSILRRKKKKKK